LLLADGREVQFGILLAVRHYLVAGKAARTDPACPAPYLLNVELVTAANNNSRLRRVQCLAINQEHTIAHGFAELDILYSRVVALCWLS